MSILIFHSNKYYSFIVRGALPVNKQHNFISLCVCTFSNQLISCPIYLIKQKYILQEKKHGMRKGDMISRYKIDIGTTMDILVRKIYHSRKMEIVSSIDGCPQNNCWNLRTFQCRQGPSQYIFYIHSVWWPWYILVNSSRPRMGFKKFPAFITPPIIAPRLAGHEVKKLMFIWPDE